MEVVLKNITKVFDPKKNVKALDDLNVTIRSGHLVGFLGPSGCGKSTSLSIIAGIYGATAGTLLFDGQDVTALPSEKRGIGMVFQNYALYPHLSVRDNIAFPLVNSKELKQHLKTELSSMPGKSMRQLVEDRVNEAALLVEISEFLDRKPAQLSGGQQQRVAIARAIVKRPQLLLLDEPLSNLDARLRLQTREEIRRIQQETGITTIFVTHDQEEALNICDEIVILRKGVFQQQGSPQEVYDRPINRFVATFLGSPSINLLPCTIVGNTVTIAGERWCALPAPLPNGKAEVGVRAENFRLHTTAQTNSLRAIIQKVSKVGGATTLDAQLSNGTVVRLFKDADQYLSSGESVWLTVVQNGAMIFDEEGGKLLQW